MPIAFWRYRATLIFKSPKGVNQPHNQTRDREGDNCRFGLHFSEGRTKEGTGKGYENARRDPKHQTDQHEASSKNQLSNHLVTYWFKFDTKLEMTLPNTVPPTDQFGPGGKNGPDIAFDPRSNLVLRGRLAYVVEAHAALAML
jgi:hypothetical protein